MGRGIAGDREEGQFEQGQGALFGCYTALFGSWGLWPPLYQWKLKESVLGKWEFPGSHISVPDKVLEKQVP